MSLERRPRLRLVVNPVASGVTPRSVQAALTALSARCDVERTDTERRGHAEELAREAIGQRDAVVVLAGDGTANEVLHAVDGAICVGVLPAGGTSVLPRALGLPRDVGAAAAQIGAAAAEGRIRSIPLGTLGDRRFAFAAGIGFDAETVRRVDAAGRERGRRPGDAYYLWQIAREVAAGRYAQPSLTIEVPGEEPVRGASLLVANGHPWSYVGRLPLRLAPRARFEDGLDAVVPTTLRRRDAARLARYLLVTGGHRSDRDPRVRYLHDVRELVVHCDRPTPAEVDGDDLGDIVEARIGISPVPARLLV